MTTQFHALRLPEKVNELVLELSRNNHVDLNSVLQTESRVIIGEPRCGKVIHVQPVKFAFGKPCRVYIGLYDLTFNRVTYRKVFNV